MKDNSYNEDQVLLMCPPEGYAIPAPNPTAGHANDFAIEGYREYQKSPKRFRDEAKKQWNALRHIFNSLGVATIEFDPKEGQPDLVFTADPSLSFQNKEGRLVTIFSRFSNEERQIEVLSHSEFFEKETPDRPLIASHYRIEGTGDNVYDPYRDLFWSGYTQSAGRQNAASGRSDQRAHMALQQMTGVDVVSLAVKRPFFHIDTSLGPLSNGHIVAYRGGMQPLAYQKMLTNAFDRFGLDRKDYLIEVSEEDAARYACNLRCVGNTVVMPNVSPDLQDRIRDKGYRVITTDLRQFIYSGGSVHCLTNNINEKRVVGGFAAQTGREDIKKLALAV